MENFTVYCPQCGNPVSCEQGREFIFCTRCGHKIILAPPQPAAPAGYTEPQPAAPAESAEQLTEAAPENPADEAAVQPGDAPEYPAADEPVPENSEYQLEPFAAPENNEYRPEPFAAPENNGYQPEPPAVPENNVYQPVPPAPVAPGMPNPGPMIPVPAPPVPAPAPQMPRPVYQPVQVEPKADLSLAISCFNRGDYDTADKCLAMLFESESENSGVWFCACKVLAAKKPEDVEQTAVKYVNFAAECLRLSGNNPEARGQLTIEFNHMLKNVVDAMVNDRLYFTPYDSNIMSESVPSVRYQPFWKSDEYYRTFYSCVCEFRNNVNPNYRDDYFRSLWNDAFYCIAHVMSKQLADDMNASKMFYWYKSELNARTPGNNAYRALCDFIYGYKNTFITMFNRVPFKDARTTIVNRIIYLDKWLLKMKYMDMRGIYVLHISDPRQRAAIEQEMRDYKIMLSRS